LGNVGLDNTEILKNVRWRRAGLILCALSLILFELKIVARLAVEAAFVSQSNFFV
jgi:hypothetical protein